MVFFDGPIPCVQTARWRFSSVSHLFVTPGNLAELHTFASRLGLRRAWFQDRPDLPHYDLCPTMADRAAFRGARHAPPKLLCAIMAEWRAHHAAERPAQQAVIRP